MGFKCTPAAERYTHCVQQGQLSVAVAPTQPATWNHSTPPCCRVSMHSTPDKSRLLLLLWLCLTCVFMSAPFSTSEVRVSGWTLTGLLIDRPLPSNPMTGQLKGAQYLLETLNVGIQSSVEFATASPSDKYRGAPLSSNDKGGLSHIYY